MSGTELAKRGRCMQLASENGSKLFAMCFYAFSSITMTLINKGAVKALPFPYFLCLIQNIVTLAIGTVVGVRVAPNHAKLGLQMTRRMTRQILYTWLPALLLFVTMLISSMSAMKHITVPSVLVFRALTPLVTAAFAMQILEERPPPSEWGALAIIVVGALCYLTSDPTFSLPGYLWMVINLASAALYHVYVKHTINKLEPTTMDLVVLNNALSLPLLLLLGGTIDDPVGLVKQLQLVSSGGWLVIGGSCLVAGLIAFSGFLLQAAVSPTTATVINHLTKVCTFVFSYFIFKDAFSPWMLIGVVLTLAGTVWYTSLQRARPPPPKLPALAEPKLGLPVVKGDESSSLLSGTKPANVV
jgi:drug/metabolite transporter (DMT)-like permease